MQEAKNTRVNLCAQVHDEFFLRMVARGGEKGGIEGRHVCVCHRYAERQPGESRERETIFNFIRRTRTGEYRPAILNLTGYPTIVYANR